MANAEFDKQMDIKIDGAIIHRRQMTHFGLFRMEMGFQEDFRNEKGVMQPSCPEFSPKKSACGCVLLVEIQQVSEVLLQNPWKVQACCHDNIFAQLKGVSLFKVPHRSTQETTHFSK